MADIKAWWNGVPPVTKWVFSLSVGTTLASHFGLLPARSLILIRQLVLPPHWELWRLATSPFLWGLGFTFLMEMFFLLRHSTQLESVQYLGRTADYVWFLVLGLLGLWTGGLLLNLMLLGQSFIMMILYVWARFFPDENMTFMFGLRFKSAYLPWVLIAFHVLMGGSPYPDLLGIIVGHCYWFAVEVLPRTHNLNLAKTPGFLRRLIPDVGVAGIRGINGGFVPAPQQRRQPEQPQQRQWGRGNVLGTN